MSEYNWRSPETYVRVQTADTTGFAWEYLRRSPNFQRDCQQAAAEPHVSTAFRSKWGLCFRP